VDARRRYLRIQAELGGPEVWLREGEKGEKGERGEKGRPATTSTAAAAASPSPSRPPGLVVERGGSDRPSHLEETWRRGAPTIPGSGVVVSSPSPQLLDFQPDYSSLDAVAEAVRACTRCALCESRANAVPGEGAARATLMCVGEGPGETEDRTGRPFVGRAGELLTEILAAIDLPRERVFIANVVKCRPPQNRKPLPDEIASCLPYLRTQIQLIRPKVLLALGATAAEALLGVRKSLNELRGLVHRYDGIPLIVTYHPAALLRNPNWKKPTWDDVRIARQLLDA
jgi:DNA polymerase